jgi:hypothetical protein
MRVLKISANNNQDKAKHQLRIINDPYILDSAAGIYKPKSIETDEDRRRKQAGTSRKTSFFTDDKTDWRPVWVTCFLSVVTLLLLGITARYAYLQWVATDQSARAAAIAACIADQTLKRRPYEFRIEQRPYVVLGEFKFIAGSTPVNSNGGTLELWFVNSGTTPALNFFLDPNSDRSAGYRVVVFVICITSVEPQSLQTLDVHVRCRAAIAAAGDERVARAVRSIAAHRFELAATVGILL